MEQKSYGILIKNFQNDIIFKNTQWDFVFQDISSELQSNPEIIFQNSGKSSWILHHGEKYISLFRSNNEKTNESIWICEDISAAKELEKRNKIMADIIDHTDEAIIFTENDGTISIYNHAHELLDQTKAEQILGQKVNEVYKKEMHTAVTQNGQPVKDLYHTYLLQNGRMINTLSSTIPVYEKNEILGVFSISRDITFSRNIMRKMNDLQEQINKEKSKLHNGTRYTLKDIIGESAAMKKAKEDASQMALSTSPVFIYGETGTGKELFAQSIHNAGMYNNEPFIAVNCAAIPENLLESILFGTEKGAYTGSETKAGMLEQAKNGTFFLDEINSMPISMQPKLLRAIQERSIRRIGGTKEIPIHCRIISACNIPPEKCIEEGLLRMDLFYRLAVLRLHVPPLRERSGDIPLLARYFAEKLSSTYQNKVFTFDDNFLYYLEQNKWPGNVRELEFTMEGCLVSMGNANTFSVRNIPAYLQIPQDANKHKDTELYQPILSLNHVDSEHDLHNALLQTEKDLIEKALKLHNGNISQSAKYLGIGRQNLQYRMKKIGIKEK